MLNKSILRNVFICSAIMTITTGSYMMMNGFLRVNANATAPDRNDTPNPYFDLNLVNDNCGKTDCPSEQRISWRLLMPGKNKMDLVILGSGKNIKNYVYFENLVTSFHTIDTETEPNLSLISPVHQRLFPWWNIRGEHSGLLPNLAFNKKYLGKLGNLTTSWYSIYKNNVDSSTELGILSDLAESDYGDGDIELNADRYASQRYSLVANGFTSTDIAVVPFLINNTGEAVYIWSDNTKLDPAQFSTLFELSGLVGSYDTTIQFTGTEDQTNFLGTTVDADLSAKDRMIRLSNTLSMNIVPSIYNWAFLGNKAQSDGTDVELNDTLPMTYNIGFLYVHDAINEDLDNAFYNVASMTQDAANADIYHTDYSYNLWSEDFSLVIVPFGNYASHRLTWLDKVSKKQDVKKLNKDDDDDEDDYKWHHFGYWTNFVEEIAEKLGVVKKLIHRDKLRKKDYINEGLNNLVSPNLSLDALSRSDFYKNKQNLSGGMSARLMFHASDVVSFGLGYIFQHSKFKTPEYKTGLFDAKSHSHGGFATISLDLGMAGFNMTAGYIIDSYAGSRDMKSFRNGAITGMTVLDLGTESNNFSNTNQASYSSRTVGDVYVDLNASDLKTFWQDHGQIVKSSTLETGSEIKTAILMYMDPQGGPVSEYADSNMDDFSSEGVFHLLQQARTGAGASKKQITKYRFHPYGMPVTAKPITKFYQSFSGSRFFAQAQGYIIIPITSVISFKPSIKVNAHYGKLDSIADYLDEKYTTKVDANYFLGQTNSDSETHAQDTTQDGRQDVNVKQHLTPNVTLHDFTDNPNNEGVFIVDGSDDFVTEDFDISSPVPVYTIDAQGDEQNVMLDNLGLIGTQAIPVFKYDNTQVLQHWYRYIKTAFATYAESINERALSVDIDLELPLMFNFVKNDDNNIQLGIALTGGYNILDPREKYDVYLSLPYHLQIQDNNDLYALTRSISSDIHSEDENDNGSMIYRESHYLGLKFSLTMQGGSFNFAFNYETRFRGFDVNHMGSVVISFAI